MTLMRYKTLYI